MENHENDQLDIVLLEPDLSEILFYVSFSGAKDVELYFSKKEAREIAESLNKLADLMPD